MHFLSENHISTRFSEVLELWSPEMWHTSGDTLRGRRWRLPADTSMSTYLLWDAGYVPRIQDRIPQNAFITPGWRWHVSVMQTCTPDRGWHVVYFEQHLLIFASHSCKNVQNMEKEILTSVWSAQHSNTGQFMQRLYSMWDFQVTKFYFAASCGRISKKYFFNTSFVD